MESEGQKSFDKMEDHKASDGQLDQETCVKKENQQADTPFSLSQLWQQLMNTEKNIGKNQDESNESGVCPKNVSIVILGKKYVVSSINDSDVEEDIYSRIWLTYRTGFEPIPKAMDGPQPLGFIQSMIFNRNIASTFNNMHGFVDNDNFTTDVGWGCMIRTSQSLLANTYQNLLLGKDFKFQVEEQNELHNKLIEAFKDNYDRPFSIHNFIQVASELPLQVKPGQWFGPNAASLSIKRLCKKLNNLTNEENLPQLEVLISESSDIYDDEVSQILNSTSISGLLILLPVRLGIDKINSIYHSSILKFLALDQSVGIAGGKPSSSFYFFGYEEPDNLLYLDPHYPQFVKSEYDAFHTKRYQSLNINDLDPSMMIGVLVKNVDDYLQFKSDLQADGNKIVHFHSSKEVKQVRRASTKTDASSARQRRNSEFVHVDTKDCHDDFVSVADRKENDDFIDLADEFDDPESLPRDVNGEEDHQYNTLENENGHLLSNSADSGNKDDTVNVSRPGSRPSESFDFIEKVSSTQVEVLDDN